MSDSGFFLVLEGPEGAGKSTLARALAERIKAAGHEPIMVREPGGTPAAEAIRAELLAHGRDWAPRTELMFMTAARADLVQQVIRPALAAGRIVISDRYELSSIAYQGAGRGLAEADVRMVSGFATGGLVPDLTLVVDLPDASVGRARQVASGKAQDRLDRESPAFHARVLARYLAEAGPGVHHLMGEQPANQLADSAWAALHAARPDLFGTGV